MEHGLVVPARTGWRSRVLGSLVLGLLALGAMAGVLLGVGVRAADGAVDPERAGVGLFDPTSGEWHLRYPDGSEHHFFYGDPGDLPLLGDWDCDGFDTVGMYRPSNGFVYVRNANGFGVADQEFFFGLAGDIPLVGDWDGDGCDTLAIYRRGRVFVRNALGTGFADYDYVFGDPGDRPFSGDFDGDGRSTVGLYRQSTGYAYLRQSNTSGPADNEFFYGDPADRILIGDWDGDGAETVGIFRPSEAAYHLSDTNATGPADTVGWFGYPSFLPVGGVLAAPDLTTPYPTTTLPIETSTTSSTTSTTASPPGPLTIMAIGDSITEGNPVAHTYRFYLSQIYGDRVDLVGSKWGVFGGAAKDGDFDQDHQAYWGWRADEVAPQVDTAADTHRPAVALIHLGTNDLLQGQDAGSTVEEIRDTIDHLRDANPDVDVFVAQIITCPGSCGSDRTELNNGIWNLAAEMDTPDARVVAVWMDNVEPADLHDGVHPSDVGSEKMFWNWEAALEAAGLL